MQARYFLLVSPLLLLAGCQRTPAPEAVPAPAVDLIAKGEYVVRLGGCNDCHTAGYGAMAGKVPKEQWLTGSAQGFMGPWGTTYASNLRLSISKMSEAEWLVYSSTFHTRPPMPDFAVRELPEEDRRALYRFVTSLGVAGNEAPAFLPPGQQPPPPYFQLVLPTPAPDTNTGDSPAAKAEPAT